MQPAKKNYTKSVNNIPFLWQHCRLMLGIETVSLWVIPAQAVRSPLNEERRPEKNGPHDPVAPGGQMMRIQFNSGVDGPREVPLGRVAPGGLVLIRNGEGTIK
jgi:hypothetical protein